MEVTWQDPTNPHTLLTHLFQNTLVEELLQFLVAVIDTELLKAVVFEILLREEKKTEEADV